MGQRVEYPALPDVGGRLPGLGGAVLLDNPDREYERLRGRWFTVGWLLAGAGLVPWVLVKLAGVGWLGWLDVAWLGLVLGGLLGLGAVCAVALARRPSSWARLQQEWARQENQLIADGYGVLLDSWGRAMASVFASAVEPGPVINRAEQFESVRVALDELAGEVRTLRDERARAGSEYQGDEGDTTLIDVVMLAGSYFDTPAAAWVDRVITGQAYTVPSLVAPRGPWSRARYDAAMAVLVPGGVAFPFGALHLVAPELLDLRRRWAGACPVEREAIEVQAHDWVITRLAG